MWTLKKLLHYIFVQVTLNEYNGSIDVVLLVHLKMSFKIGRKKSIKLTKKTVVTRRSFAFST